MTNSQRPLTFDHAFAYPYRRKRGLLNILWIFVPVLGQLLILGYSTRIAQSFCEGKFDRLPKVRILDHVGTGFFILLKLLPFALVYGIISVILGATPFFFLPTLFMFVAAPLLYVHFFFHERARAFFEWGIFRHANNHASEYFLALGKTYVLGLAYLALHVLIAVPIIAILVVKNSEASPLTSGELIIPVMFFAIIFLSAIAATSFTQNIFIADFYRKRVLRK